MQTYDITPVAKPRMTQKDRFAKRKCVLKYWAFKDECKKKNVKLYPAMRIIFYMPMPKSWSKKKKLEMDDKPHQQTPDTDNLTKGLLDILKEDSHIWHTDTKKIWAYNGKISIEEIT